jgi:hypothetical protein
MSLHLNNAMASYVGKGGVMSDACLFLWYTTCSDANPVPKIATSYHLYQLLENGKIYYYQINVGVHSRRA